MDRKGNRKLQRDTGRGGSPGFQVAQTQQISIAGLWTRSRPPMERDASGLKAMLCRWERRHICCATLWSGTRIGLQQTSASRCDGGCCQAEPFSVATQRVEFDMVQRDMAQEQSATRVSRPGTEAEKCGGMPGIEEGGGGERNSGPYFRCTRHTHREWGRSDPANGRRMQRGKERSQRRHVWWSGVMWRQQRKVEQQRLCY